MGSAGRGARLQGVQGGSAGGRVRLQGVQWEVQAVGLGVLYWVGGAARG